MGWSGSGREMEQREPSSGLLEQNAAIFIAGDTNSLLKGAEFLKCPRRPGCFITNNPAGCTQAGWGLQSSTRTFLGLVKLL